MSSFRGIIVASAILISRTPDAAIAQAVDASSSSSSSAACDLPSVDCVYGLWSSSSCECECIPPYCIDGSGSCTLPDGCVGRPWGDCAVGVDCPWWDARDDDDDSGGGASSSSYYYCDTGPDIPPGVWVVHATRGGCCAAHHPGSAAACEAGGSAAAAAVGGADAPDDDDDDDPFEYVTIKFTVGDLPAEVVGAMDAGELKAEMSFVMRRALTDLAERVEILKITSIEEDLVLTVMPTTIAAAGGEKNGTADGGGGGGGPATAVSVYYDVTVVRHPTESLGEIIIAGLRDIYPEMMEWLSGGSSRQYLVCCVYLNWCYDGGANDGTFDLCSGTDDTVAWTVRFADLPSALDWEGLARELVGIYKETLMGVERLDIVDVEVNVVDLPSADGGNETVAKDVTFDFIIVDKFDINFGPVINETLHNSKNDTLSRIQGYIDASTTLDLAVCIDGDGSYAVCPKPVAEPQEWENPFLLPLWAIITLAAGSVVLCCCTSWCIISYLNQRDESKNERNMVTYIQTGKNHDNIRRKRRPLPQQRHAPSRPQSQRPRESPPPRHYETRSTRRLEHRDPDTEYLEAMPSFVFPDDKETQPKQVDDTLYLENMPSFVFDHADARPPHLPLPADGHLENPIDLSSKPNPVGVLEYGSWSDDDEKFHQYGGNCPPQRPLPTVQRKLLLEP